MNVISHRGFHFTESREGEYSVEVPEGTTFHITDHITLMAIEALFVAERKRKADEEMWSPLYGRTM